jgi:hypothetical protein
MSINVILPSVFFIGFLLLLAGLIFFTFYRRFPYVMAMIREVTLTEKTTGNAVIVTTWIHYAVFGKSRYKTVVFSGYASRRGKLRAQAQQIQDFYKGKEAKYHYLPGLSRVGVLEGSITRGYLWACAMLTAIFGVVSGVAFYWGAMES